jgi:transcriptional regulator with XRE-family HTH domain
MLDDRVVAGLHSIAANIRRLRILKKWTQEQLAEAAGVEPRYVQTLESGRANPTASILISVAAALESRPGSLFRPAPLPERPPGRPRRTPPRRRPSGRSGR